MSTHNRPDRILDELTARYDLQERFLEKLRPMVEKIFSEDIRDSDRTMLLEMLAETCERDRQLREGSEALRQAFVQLIATLRALQAHVRKLRDDPRPGTEGA